MKCGLLASGGHAAYIRVKTVSPSIESQNFNGIRIFIGTLTSAVMKFDALFENS
jgi:hypothetical protein